MKRNMFATIAVAARLARREVRRRPGRTALVALLVAFPVMGMTTASAFIRTSARTPAEEWRDERGASDAATEVVVGDLPPLTLPEGSRSISYRTDYRLLRTENGRRLATQVMNPPLEDPLTRGMVVMTAGRPPRARSEVALTAAAARGLGVTIGDRLDLVRPEPRSLTVVGIGERASWWKSQTIFLANDAAFPWSTGPQTNGSSITLIDLPADVAVARVKDLATRTGVQVAPGLKPADFVLPEGGVDAATEQVAWSWVMGAVVLTVVGIVIASAFAAGARRQMTTLGQLSANGATPRILRQMLFLQGTGTGIVGAAVGLPLAAIALAVLAPHMDGVVGRNVDPFRIRVSDVTVAVALGIAAATLAALLPAHSSSRVPVLAALAGRRPLASVPRWLPTAGLAVIAAGAALLALAVLGADSGTNARVWMLTAILGGVAVLLGACAVAPGYVSVLGPIAEALGGSWRLAARSLARQRTRTSAVVSAICASVALAVAASSLLLSADKGDEQQPWIRSDEVHLQASAPQPLDEQSRFVRPGASIAPPAPFVSEIEEVLRASGPKRFDVGVAVGRGELQWSIIGFGPSSSSPPGAASSVATQFGGGGAAVVDDVSVGAYDLTDTELSQLRRSGALAFGEAAGRGTAAVRTVADGVLPSSPDVEFEVDVRPVRGRPLGSLPSIILTKDRAAALGFDVAPGIIVFRANKPLSAEQADALGDVYSAFEDDRLDQGAPLHLSLSWSAPQENLDPLLVEALLVTVALLFSVFVVAASLALAAAETRDERDVLTVVGMPPATLRRTSAQKAALLTLLGGAIAIPVGLLPVAVFITANDDQDPFVFPWRTTALMLLFVPVVAAGLSWFGSALGSVLRPARVSTMTFE